MNAKDYAIKVGNMEYVVVKNDDGSFGLIPVNMYDSLCELCEKLTGCYLNWCAVEEETFGNADYCTALWVMDGEAKLWHMDKSANDMAERLLPETCYDLYEVLWKHDEPTFESDMVRECKMIFKWG